MLGGSAKCGWCTSGAFISARAVARALPTVVALIAIAACSPTPPSSTATDVDGSKGQALDGAPALTDDCRSWADLDLATLAPLPDGPWRADFERVWDTVRVKHYDPTLGCLDWVELRELYGAKVGAAKDVDEAYAAMNALLATLGQSHLHALAPSGNVTGLAELDGTHVGPEQLELTVRALDEGVIVAGPGYSMDPTAPAPALPSGARLVAIDELMVDDLVAETKRRPRAGESERVAVQRALARALTCPAGARKSLSYLDPAEADARKVVELPCTPPSGERMSLGNLRDLPVEVEAYVVPETKVGVLRFNVWMVPLVERIRAALDGLRDAGIDALVLDLRGNPGGVGAMALPIARLLLPEGGDLGTLRMRDFSQRFEVPRSPEAFAGPVVVLVDEGTASTSEIFAVGLRDLGRISVIGASPSAGAALPSLLETLPSGGLLQVVVGDYRSPKGTVAEGAGIPLDVTVAETRADWIAGRDPVLTAALAHLARQPTARPAPSGDALGVMPP